MKTWTIYCYTNKINGKKYVGQTCCSTTKRANKDGSGYCTGSQICFENAIKKYGWDNFELSILESNIETLDCANSREQFWIAYYHTYINDENSAGYNMTPGGNARGEVTAKTKHKISEHAKTYIGEKNPFYGKHHTDETKKLIGQKSLNRQTFLGKKHSAESKEKMRQSQLGIKPTNSKKCKCIVDGVVFLSYNDAAKYYCISAGSVGNSIRNNKKLRCGLQFILVE